MKEPSDKVRRVLNLLMEQIAQGLLYFYCARSLDKAFQQSGLMMRSYFFSVVYHAAMNEAVLALSRVMKEHKDSVTIHYLFNLVESEQHLLALDGPETVRRSVADHKSRLEKYQVLIESALEQRDRRGAHLDRKHVNTPSDVFKYPQGVNVSQLQECFVEVLDILNFYARYYDEAFVLSHLESAIEGDVDILLRWMREHGRPEEWIRPPVF